MAKTNTDNKKDEGTNKDLVVNIQSYLDMVGADKYQRKYFSLKFKDLEVVKTLKEWERETSLVFKS